jgi:hypothetical protein
VAVCCVRASKTDAQIRSSDQVCLSIAAWGLFYKATCPAMTDENTSQNGISDWSLFHRTTSDKRLVNCNKATVKFEPFDKYLFYKDFFLSHSAVIG